MLQRQITFALLSALILVACASPATSTPTAAPLTAEVPTAVSPVATAMLPATAQPTTPARATAQPTAPPPATATTAPQATAQPTAPAQSPGPSGSFGEEILFLRQGVLLAFDLRTRQERRIAGEVRDFVATPDGTTIALVRGAGRQTEIWSVQRDGGALTQLTGNDRAEATPAWAPDGLALVFASAATDKPFAREWRQWSQWCAESEVRLLDLASRVETSLGAGCDPAFSPDGLRIAYAAPPTAKEPDYPGEPPLIVNGIRLINRKGQNGWNFATASGPTAPPPNGGRLVYAPAWSPDSRQIVYHRFVGYQALVDLDLIEIGGSFEGQGKLLGSGAGWLLPARFAPDGRSLAISENNYGDPRGFGGYDNWSVSLIGLEGTREIALPSGTFTAVGQQIARLPRGQSAVWSLDGTALAVELPPGWRADLSQDQPIGADERPGEVWRWRPGDTPAEQLFAEVDFASPLAWLPPTP